MDEKSKKFFSTKTVIFDSIITLIFFFFISTILRSFVPTENETTITIVALAVGLCLASIFFIAVQMFRATLTDQLARRKK